MMRDFEFLDEPACLDLRSGYLVTVNMQHVYESRANAMTREAIFHGPGCKLCLDGRGAAKLFERLSGDRLPIVQGNGLLRHRLAFANGQRLLVIGSSETVISQIRGLYPEVDFVHEAAIVPILDEPAAAGIASATFRKFGTEFDLIAIALGVPKQEMLARAMYGVAPHTPIYCVGGSFEMIAGLLPRAPRLVQVMGLEGVWRFFLQPNKARLSRLVRSYWNFAELFIDREKLVSVVSIPRNEK